MAINRRYWLHLDKFRRIPHVLRTWSMACEAQDYDGQRIRFSVPEDPVRHGGQLDLDVTFARVVL